MYYTYVVMCTDKSLYTGTALDVKKRIFQHYHKLSAAAKYTKSHQVCDVLMIWESEEKVAAMKLEYRIKKLSKDKKLYLCSHPLSIDEIFPDLHEYAYIPKSISISECI